MDGQDWIGKAVSITCCENLGIFQGIIKEISESEITIVRAFRNGVPLRKQQAEVTLRSTDILKINFIPSTDFQNGVTPTATNQPTPVSHPDFVSLTNGAAGGADEKLQPPPLKLKWNILHIENGSGLNNALSKLSLSQVPSNGLSTPPIFPISTSTDAAPQVGSFNGSSNKSSPSMFSTSVAEFFGNMIPPKVETRLGAALVAPVQPDSSSTSSVICNGVSKPIDIAKVRPELSNGNGNGGTRSRNGYCSGANGFSTSNGGGSAKKHVRKHQMRWENSVKHHQTFGTSVDDPLLHEDFDFEGNLALFDKKALWDDIESDRTQETTRPALAPQEKKYRHDENILEVAPLEVRQIKTVFAGAPEFVTDEGLIIPTIPTFVRKQVEENALKTGFLLNRQLDALGYGVTTVVLMLLGGARRLTLRNNHQWPKIVIVCEKSKNHRASITGAIVGRIIASHGLKVFLYLEDEESVEKQCADILTFRATNNKVVYLVAGLSAADLVIVVSKQDNLTEAAKKWLGESRASILAIDPPAKGIDGVSIKYSLIPILPIMGISTKSCGKLYLCNLSIPEEAYTKSGITYKSPFGCKNVISLHARD